MISDIIWIAVIIVVVIGIITDRKYAKAYNAYTAEVKKQNEILWQLHKAEEPCLKQIAVLLLKSNHVDNPAEFNHVHSEVPPIVHGYGKAAVKEDD
jgi:hypothetical protein